ncbi:hypothetical protein Vafri_20606 [Volvox africanus]|uniref:ABC transporter domain-containing protein n=1 Tax=Volvox africanus TaxID=51714 RepID=A0A8J4BRP8_9CHLO|nr:hypothetical protein Vafri_20606 [Volvox africanus]
MENYGMATGQADTGEADFKTSSPDASRPKRRMRRVDTAAVLGAVNGDSGGIQELAFLQRLAERLQRVGLSFPGVEVRWQDLEAEVEVPSHGPRAYTVLSALLAGLETALVAPLKALICRDGRAAGPQSRIVLDAGSGRLAPGRMCLLLGPPGAGKTTLLKVLAGQALPGPAAAAGVDASKAAAGSGGAGGRETGGLRVRGRLLYNGLTPGSDFTVERSGSYISQHDLHIGEMTVEETLMFAAECLGPSLNKGLHDLLLERETAAGITPDPDLDRLWSTAYGPHGHTLMVELFAQLLGIDHVMDIVVGNEMLKGISGGQKRRVTCGEMAVGFAQVMMLDEITNGLDSNSALAIVRSFRNICQYTQATMLVSLLQPSPEVFECFDDVMLLSGGRLVFLGPRTEVVPFFSRLGLEPPPSKTEADFLQEVTASPEYQFKYRIKGGLAETSGHRWLSPRRLRQEFDSSPVGQQLVEQLGTPPYSHELQSMVLHKERYALSLARMWWVVAMRELMLFFRNKIFFVAGAVQIAFTAFLVSTTFIRLSKNTFNDANLHMSVIFFSLMTIFMGGFNFCPIYCQRLAVFYKQRDHKFYSASAYAVSCFLMRLPELLVQSSMWALMVYFSTGFVQDAGRFFIFWLNLLAGGFYSVAIFQLLGSVTRHEVIAQGLGAVMLMLSVLASGFPIARSSIPPWWIWFYWCNPMAWALRSMAINELTSSAWSKPATEFNRPDISIGQYALIARGFFTEWKWVWAGIGTVCGLSLVLLALQVVALAVMSAPSTYRPPLDEEEEEKAGELRLEDEKDNDQVVEMARQANSSIDGSKVRKEDGNGNDVNNGNSHGHVHVYVPPKGHAPPPPPPPPPAGGRGGAASNGQNANGDGAADLALHVPTYGSNLSFTPVVMAFRGINYFVPDPKGSGELQLLNGISGLFLPGVLTSLMGASGAGKTTLMDVLAGRKTGGRQDGEQLVNGAPKRKASFARLMGYVEQFDAHNPQATVEEALLFSARLRVPHGVLSRSSIRSYVAEVMEVVELGPLAKHAVGAGGAVGGGLSTEARKRLTIACELVANPSIVFLDEPTTGLDARAAGTVMRAVRNTVATGRTVVCTIHQPNREIMDYFDELLLLKPGGRVIFNGPVGRPNQTELITYLESIPGVPKYQPVFNPANYMLEVTSPAAERDMEVDFAELWEKSDLATAANARLQQNMEAGCEASHAANGASSHAATAAATATHHRYAQPAVVQLYLLVQRFLISYWRNPAYNLLRLVVTVLLGLALGTLYWDRGMKRSTLLGVLDIMGALFTTSLFLAMTNCLVVMPVVMSERAVFYRERASGMYSSVVFAMAQGLAEFPYLFVQSVVYVIIVYCTTQYEFDSAKALWFWLFIWLNLLCFTYLGMGCMNLAPNMPACVAMSSFAVLLWNLFCGFLIYREDIKPWWLWAYYFNPATYSIYGCIVTQLGDVTDELIDVGGGKLMSVADFVETTFSYQYDMRGWLVLIMISFIVLFRSFSYIGLSFLNFQVR